MVELLLRFLLFIFIQFKIKEINSQQTFIEQAKNQTVLLGEDATLKCVVKNQKGELIWCRDESFCTFGRKRNITFPRISVVGDETKGENNLLIKNVTISDNTQYQCQVTAFQNEKAIKSDWTFLTVLVKPSSVIIVSNNKDDNGTIRLTTNQTTSIECISENSNPPCNFTWFLDSQELKVGGEITEISKKQLIVASTKLYKTTGKIVFKPITTNWHLKSLKCECQIHPSAPSTLTISDTKSVLVNYSPVLKIWKLSENDVIHGTIIQFECISDARPPVNFYKWYIGDRVLSSGSDEKYLYLRIENSMHKQQLKCEAKNEIATQTAVYQIEVSYGPKFIKELPSHKMVKLDESLTLTCDVDANPPALIYWSLNDTSIYAFPTMSISSMKPENYGTYKCTASLKDFPKVSSSIKIVPPGPPVIEVLTPQYSYYGLEGSVECIIEKEPKPDVIEWFKLDTPIDFQKTYKYKLNNIEMTNRGIKSKLQIREVGEDDFANFSCKATNIYGSTIRKIELRPKTNEYENLYPLAIIFVFLFIASGIVVFFVYLKFMRKKKGKNSKRSRKFGDIYDLLKSKPSQMIRGIDGKRRRLPRQLAHNHLQCSLRHNNYQYLNKRRFFNQPKLRSGMSSNIKNSNSDIYSNYGSMSSPVLNTTNNNNYSQLNGSNQDFNYLFYEYGNTSQNPLNMSFQMADEQEQEQLEENDFIQNRVVNPYLYPTRQLDTDV